MKGGFVDTDKIKGKEFVLMKIMGFSPKLSSACKIDKYMFTTDPQYVQSLLICEMEELHRLPKWIKAEKKKQDNIDKLIEEYQIKYPLLKSAIQENYESFRYIVENNIEQFLRELGITDEKTYKKFGIVLKPATKSTLDGWF